MSHRGIYKLKLCSVLVSIMVLIAVQDAKRTTASIDSQMLLEQRCGTQTETILAPSHIWAIASDNRSAEQSTAIHAIPNNAKWATPHLVVSDNASRHYEFRLSNSGDAVMFLTSDFPSQESPIPPASAIEVSTRDGLHLSLSTVPNIWQLGPELQPGHFGVLSYDTDLTAMLVDVSWTNQMLIAKTVERLPFKYPTAGSLIDKSISIAPDWSYIAYTENYTDLKIYSVSQKRIIASISYLGRIPNVSWPLLDKAVALVNMAGADGNAQIMNIDRQGNVQILADLDMTLGREVRLLDFTYTVNANHEIGLIVNLMLPASGADGGKVQSNTSLYYLLNVDSGKVIDLCFSLQAPFEGFQWVERGQYIMFQTLVADGTAPGKLIFLSAKSGDYSYVYPVKDGKLLDVIGWANNP